MTRLSRIMFVRELSEATTPAGTSNPYADPLLSANLLHFMDLPRKAKYVPLFVGEAPGYRGAAVTGVPFASASVLTNDWADPWGIFGTDSGFVIPPDAQFLKEATSTIFWDQVSDVLGDHAPPLTWNAFPFHPARGGSPESNRPISAIELSLGVTYLRTVLQLNPNVVPVAVGRTAAAALSDLGVEHIQVRHPSHGGKAEFRHGLHRLRDVLVRGMQGSLI